MQGLSRSAVPYAKAAFEFSQSVGQLDEWSRFVSTLGAVIENSLLKEFVARPDLGSESVISLLCSLCEGVTKEQKNFVRLLVQNKRLGEAPEIFKLFSKRRAVFENKEEVEITTAVPLDQGQRNVFEKRLSEKLGGVVDIEFSVSKDLIGGVVVRSGDWVIDRSVRASLKQLRSSLLA